MRNVLVANLPGSKSWQNVQVANWQSSETSTNRSVDTAHLSGVDAVPVLLKEADIEFVVVQQPRRGRLVRYEEGVVLPVIQFDAEDLTARRIAYKHDQVSPDTAAATMDTFGVVAYLSLRAKRSEPRTVHVAIAARNVQHPHITILRALNITIGNRVFLCFLLLFVYHSFEFM